jgi:ABC-type Zn2+ transport system substrate-binding protein/surface adhesin
LKINKLYNYSFQITACKDCITEAKNEVTPAAGQRVKRHEHDHDHIHDHSHAVEHDHGVRQLCPGLCKDETMTAVSFILYVTNCREPTADGKIKNLINLKLI